ncbi:MAG: M14 family metallopeptidase [Bacteroidales bacterium]|nr:M14 family metallopeptidase [Bacteroidales bacterium]
MKKVLSLIGFLIITISVFSQNSEWITYYKKSDFLETPRYDETMEYTMKLAESSDLIEYISFGTSLQGRDLPLLIIDKNKNFTPESVRESGNAVLFIEACIHPGESEGKDAGLMLIRDIIIHNKYPKLLDNTTILFIPIFNVDGHERFSAYNRINQNGPKEMGWRTTANNLNLNRDFIKADAVEMQYWLKLFNEWLPDLFIDIHTTDGADYQYSLTYGMHVLGDMNKEQTEWQNNYLSEVEEKLLDDDVLIFPYVSFRRWHDPRSGLIRRTASPRYSTGYSAYQNRPALLVETHMLKDYKTRVDATYHLLRHTIEIVDNQHTELKEINKNADSETKDLAGKEIVLEYYTSGKDSSIVKFKGVEYNIVHSDLTDDIWVQFSDIPKDYDLVLFDKQMPASTAKLPQVYIIPVEWTEVINRLAMHGIQHITLQESKEFEIETYKFSNVSFSNSPFEGRQMVQNFDMEEISIKKLFSAGSVIIPTNQRTAKIIAHILEPIGPDSYVRWGFFNSIFERKEYVETYVMEKMAREMIEENPELRDEYEQAIKENPQYYNNQWTKLFWFYERTPYWDQQKNVYPVGKIYDMEAKD